MTPDQIPAPRRIQRRRTRGFRTPLDSQGRSPVYVGRPTRYGNPAQIARVAGGIWVVFVDAADGVTGRTIATVSSEREARQVAVEMYADYVDSRPELAALARQLLYGLDLACWCPEDMPCHADVLLRVAAGGAP